MRTMRYITIGFLLCGIFAGCDFLDVDPDGKVKDQKMFSDVQGYRDAMYGVYASMAKPELYGRNLSFEFADQLGQLFFCPSGSNQKAWKTLAYEYRDQLVRPTVDTIWSRAYRTIAYANNILTHIDGDDLNKDPDIRLIKGEALAVRAFLHFDVIRLFCDNDAQQAGARGIPYSYTFDLRNKKLYDLRESYSNVLADLSQAQGLLAGEGSLRIGADSGERKYVQDRYTHANLHAVHAVKARVFHWMGDLDSAAVYAMRVIESGEFALMQDPSEEMGTEMKFPGKSELIWGLYNDRLYDTLSNLFLVSWRTNHRQTVMRKDAASNVYGYGTWLGGNDYRWDKFVDNRGENAVFVRLLRVDMDNPADVTVQRANTKGICLLRLPEMYYIYAEAMYGKNPGLAGQYLQTVRESRGLKVPLAASQLDTFDKFRAELLNERRKEMYGEGQVFFEHKRQNADLFDINGMSEDSRIRASKSIFVLPWPDDELEFGQSKL